jgi:hypothetical protein
MLLNAHKSRQDAQRPFICAQFVSLGTERRGNAWFMSWDHSNPIRVRNLAFGRSWPSLVRSFEAGLKKWKTGAVVLLQ